MRRKPEPTGPREEAAEDTTRLKDPMSVDHDIMLTVVLDGKLCLVEISVLFPFAGIPVETDSVQGRICVHVHRARYLLPVAPDPYNTVIFAV